MEVGRFSGLSASIRFYSSSKTVLGSNSVCRSELCRPGRASFAVRTFTKLILDSPLDRKRPLVTVWTAV